MKFDSFLQVLDQEGQFGLVQAVAHLLGAAGAFQGLLVAFLGAEDEGEVEHGFVGVARALRRLTVAGFRFVKETLSRQADAGEDPGIGFAGISGDFEPAAGGLGVATALLEDVGLDHAGGSRGRELADLGKGF